MPSPMKALRTGETSEEDEEDDAGAYQRRHGARNSDDGLRASLAGSEEENVVGSRGVGASELMLAPACAWMMAMTAVLLVVVLVPQQPLLTTSMLLVPAKKGSAVVMYT